MPEMPGVVLLLFCGRERGMIETLTVKVYRGEDRRKRFTRRAAINGTAWARLKKKIRPACECEPETGFRCGTCRHYWDSMFEGRGYSNGPYMARTRAHQIAFRYSRILARRDRLAKPSPAPQQGGES
jgi:hypothetical protein